MSPRSRQSAANRAEIFFPTTDSEDSDTNLGTAALSARRMSKARNVEKNHQNVSEGFVAQGVAQPPPRDNGVEDPELRRQRLLEMRNRRLGETAETPSTTTDDFFDPAALIAQEKARRLSQAGYQADRIAEKQAEAQRKQESRERALRKSQKGRAVPLARSRAPLLSVQEKKKKRASRALTPTVDFGSESESNHSENPDEDEYFVQAIVGHEIVDGEVMYEVKWRGYPSDQNTLEPEGNFNKPHAVLDAYQKKHMISQAGPAPIAPMM